MILNVRSCDIDECGGCAEYEDYADYIADPLDDLVGYDVEEWDEEKFVLRGLLK